MMTRRRFSLAGLAAAAASQLPAPACPVIDHLACKIPGELEPRIYDVWANLNNGIAIFAGTNLPHQFVEIGNRDAPWHLAGGGVVQIAGAGALSVRVYNSVGFGISDDLIRVGHQFGGRNAIKPFNPSLVWPVNSSLIFDISVSSGGTFSGSLFFYGFKIYDRGKAPC